MAVGRVGGIRLVASTDIKGRVGGIRLIGTAPTGSRGRVGAVRLTGTLPAGSKGRVGGVRLLGTVGLVLSPIPARTVEPLQNVDITAALAQGTATDYVWRVISGPAGVTVTLVGTGAQRVFRAPGRLGGGTIVVGVRATNGSTSSAEVIATITVRPQIEWVRQHGGDWVPGDFVF